MNYTEWKRQAEKSVHIVRFLSYNTFENAKLPVETESITVDAWRWGCMSGRGLHRDMKELWGWGMCSVSWLWLWFHRCIDMSKLIKLYTLNTCSLLYVTYTSIKLVFKKESTDWEKIFAICKTKKGLISKILKIKKFSPINKEKRGNPIGKWANISNGIYIYLTTVAQK